MLDNIDIAILTRVNELAERHGLRPTDFVATVRDEAGPNGALKTVLDYELPAAGNALREGRFEAMIRGLGVTPDAAGLAGTPDQILDALDQAIDKAPRPRGRF